MKTFFDELVFNEKGLIPAIIQDAGSGEVLTLCYMNRQALERTLAESQVFLYRRSKNRLMAKGETSGHIQILRELFMDCEGKSLLLKVEQKVAACHLGYFTCYFRKLDEDGSVTTVGERVFDPKQVYK